MDLSEQILAAQDLPREAVECPEWGAGADGKPLVLWVRKASARELSDWDQGNAVFDKEGNLKEILRHNSGVRLLVKVLETEDGRRVFTDAQAEALSAKAGDVVVRLSEVAIRLAGRGAAKKNSGTTPNSSSSTD